MFLTRPWQGLLLTLGLLSCDSHIPFSSPGLGSAGATRQFEEFLFIELKLPRSNSRKERELHMEGASP